MDYGTNGGTCEFSTLEAALNAAGPNGTVFVKSSGSGGHAMPGNTTISQDVTIEGGDSSCRRRSDVTSPTARLNGDALSDRRVFSVSAGVRLTLVKVRVTGGVALQPDPGPVPPRGGTIRLLPGAKLGLLHSEVEGGTAETGGCIFGEKASVALAGGSSVTGCSATPLGIASLEGLGGGVALGGGSLFVLDSSSISGNSSTHFGGNISAIDNVSVVIQGDVNDGEADVHGGGVFLSFGSKLFLSSDASVSRNSAGSDGGGVFMIGSELSATSDVTFGSNFAGSQGGAIFAQNSTVETDDDVTFVENASVFQGGAIFADGSTVDVEDRGHLRANVSKASGGAIFATASDVTFRGSVHLQDNSAHDQGGAVRAVDGSTVRLTGASPDNTVLLEGNHATHGGGGISVSESDVVSMFADFFSNHAGNPSSANSQSLGGAIEAHADSFVKLENSSVRSNSAGSGGGISARDSNLVIRSIFRSCKPDASSGDPVFCSELTDNRAFGQASGGLFLGGQGGGVLLRGESDADIRTTFFGGNLAVDQSHSDGAGSGLAQVQFAGAGSVLLLNAIFDGNVGGSAATVFSNAGDMAIRNSTFVGSSRALDWTGSVAGAFDSNLVMASGSQGVRWPSNTPGSCNLFSNSNVPLPVGTGNVSGVFVPLADYHPVSASSPAVDACPTGPVFDIMGTRRPKNGAFDRGAVELIQ